MSDRFQRAKPAHPFEWTGERLTSGVAGQIDVEHVHRYFVARHLCKGLDVLDIASGEGYGGAFLAQTARSVVGVDLNLAVVEHARETYTAPNLRFQQGNALSIPLHDQSVDCVVSFETIEHFYDHQTFLAEIRRVLRANGRLIISSPDRDVYSPPGSKPNPYHMRELTRSEFSELLSRFANVSLLGQRPIVGSLIVPISEVGERCDRMTFERLAEDLYESTIGLQRPLYLFAVASDAALPPLPESFYFEKASVDDATVALPALRQLAAQKDAKLAETESQLAEKESQLAEKDSQLAEKESRLLLAVKNIKELHAHLGRLDELIAQRDTQIAEYLYHLDRINASVWWRLGLSLDKLIRASGALFATSKAKLQDTPALEPPTRLASVAPETIALPPTSPEPEVSVVILSYGQVDYTLRCLASIAQAPPLSSVEIIVSDDCPNVLDLQKLTQVKNLIFWRTPKNLGFLKHANWAVAQTRGTYVFLLNNDTEVMAGAIDTLVETAKNTAYIGLVGSKLVYPDGKLQEAGGIVWNDATAWNYGHLDDPERPEYNYLRDVDYASAASILVPRAVWDQVGGFDESFAPAYYEDTDLAFRLRQIGLRVIYQPEAVVVHYESVSHGTDLTSGTKSHQVANQLRMKERWLAILHAEQYPNGQNVGRARDRAKNKRIMLMIDHYFPEPDRDAGSRNMIDIIKSFQCDGWIIKFWPENLHYDPVYTRKLQQMGVEAVYGAWTTSFDDWISARGEDIDLVFLSRPNVAKFYLETIRRTIPNVPRIFYGHDLHCARMRMQARVSGAAALAVEADSMEALERQIWRNVDLVLYPSQEEADEVRRMEPCVDARTLLPFCFDEFRSLRSPPSSSVMLFVAGFAHPPNVDAAVWFARDVLPIILRDAPSVRLWIVGSHPTPKVKNLASNVIEVTGYVTEFELARRYDEARVAVVPLRIGAGVKLKVVESLHVGLPLVTTSVGAQGLEGLGEAATIVDGAEAFAQEVLRLLRDDAAWEKQAQRQLNYASARFSRQASIAVLIEAVNVAKANSERRVG